MRYKELQERVTAWDEKYNLGAIVKKDHASATVEINYAYKHEPIAHIDMSSGFIVDLFFFHFRILPEDAKEELFKIIAEFTATKPEDRKDEKRFIIPLPRLVTTDGKQQYLTHKDGHFFASRRRGKSRQTWKEEHLKFVPEVYRQFAVEFDEDTEY